MTSRLVKIPNRLILLTTVLMTLFMSSFAFATDDDIPSRPYPPQLVNDFANILSYEERTSLETKLDLYNDSTSTQIAVVTVKDLGGYDISDYSFKLGEKWGVGQKSTNNGIIIVIKPKTDNSNGRAFIAVGYGLEEIITDAATRMIIENEMIPSFKENNYYQGIDKSTSVLMDLASKKYSSSDYARKNNELFPTIIVILLIIITIIVASFTKRGKNGGGGITFGGGPFMGGMWIGGFGDGGSSFGGGSSSGGGGFGGFGGGSFGGGGAGGSW